MMPQSSVVLGDVLRLRLVRDRTADADGQDDVALFRAALRAVHHPAAVGAMNQVRNVRVPQHGPRTYLRMSAQQGQGSALPTTHDAVD